MEGSVKLVEPIDAGRQASRLEDIEMPHRHLVASLFEQSEKHYGERLQGFLVFGSVARRSAHADSDLDFLLVIDPLPNGRMARVRDFLPIEQSLATELQDLWRLGWHCELSPIFKTPEEVMKGSPLMFDMTVDGCMVFEKNGIITAALNRLRLRMQELGSRRVFSQDGWYWNLKPDYRPGEIFTI